MVSSKFSLFAIIMIVAVLASSPFSCTTSTFVKDIEPKNAYQMIKDGDPAELVILDVCTREEYAQSRINNSINIDFYGDDFKDNISKLDREKTYIVYCLTGQRSSEAIQVMKEAGFQRLYNLKGGILRWNSEGLPLEE